MLAGKTGVLIVGAGGHAKVVIDVMRAAGFTPVGLLDPKPIGTIVSSVPVLGGDEIAGELFQAGHRHAFVALGHNGLRRTIARRLLKIGFFLPSLIHPTSYVSPSAVIGAGVVVMPKAIINADADIASFAIINSGAIVEHDCRIGEAAHIAPQSVIGGYCIIEEEVLFGIGTVARPQSRVGARSVVGAGSVIIGDIAEGVTAWGAPARANEVAGVDRGA